MKNHTSTLYCSDNKIIEFNSNNVSPSNVDKKQHKLRPLKDIQMKYRVR
jgi:hypothetical protein